MMKLDALRRLANNPKTSTFVQSLKHSDLPKNWADDPEIVQMAADVYSEMGESSPFYKAWFGDWEAKRAAQNAINGEPVTHLTGNEFQKDGVPLTDKVPAWYQQEYKGKAVNPELGDVLLNKQGVDDSISHGVGSVKASGFAATPEIIHKGIIYDRQPNWKGRSWDSAVIAAPVDYAGAPYIGEVVAKTRGDTGQYQLYLHELEDKNKLESVFKTPSSPQMQLGAQIPASRLILGQKADNVKMASAVVDENGRPLVVYRSDPEEIHVFDRKKAKDGFFFTDYEKAAEMYPGETRGYYLRIQNPKITPDALPNEVNATDLVGTQYDGAVNQGAYGANEYVATSPNQIKSVKNRGTFNPADDDSYKGLLGLIGTGAVGAALGSPEQAQAAEDAAVLSRFNELADAGMLPGQRRAEEMARSVPVTYASDPMRNLSLGARAATEGVLGAPSSLANTIISPFTDFRFGNPGEYLADLQGQANPVTASEKLASDIVYGAGDALPWIATGAGMAKYGRGIAQGVGDALKSGPKTQTALGALLGMFGRGE